MAPQKPSYATGYDMLEVYTVSSLCSGRGDVARLLTSVAAVGRHGNEYNNNNNNGGGAVGDDANGRPLLSGGKPATGTVSTTDDLDRPLNLEINKRIDAKLERPDSLNPERDSTSGI